MTVGGFTRKQFGVADTQTSAISAFIIAQILKDATSLFSFTSTVRNYRTVHS